MNKKKYFQKRYWFLYDMSEVFRWKKSYGIILYIFYNIWNVGIRQAALLYRLQDVNITIICRYSVQIN